MAPPADLAQVGSTRRLCHARQVLGSLTVEASACTQRGRGPPPPPFPLPHPVPPSCLPLHRCRKISAELDPQGASLCPVTLYSSTGQNNWDIGGFLDNKWMGRTSYSGGGWLRGRRLQPSRYIICDIYIYIDINSCLSTIWWLHAICLRHGVPNTRMYA